MQIIAQCPRCGCRWQLDASNADKRIRCEKCSRLFKIPRLTELPKALKIIKQAKGDVFVDKNGKTFG